MNNNKGYEPKPGDRVLIHKKRKYSRTPHWTDGYLGEIIRINKSGTATVRLDEYPEERHYIDIDDLVPERIEAEQQNGDND